MLYSMTNTKKAPYRPGDAVLAMHCMTHNGGTVLDTGTVATCDPTEPRSNTNREWRLTVTFSGEFQRNYTIRGRESDYVLPADSR